MRYDVVRYVVGQTLRIISVPFLIAMLGNLAFALNDPDFESYPIAAFATPGAIALIAGTILSKGVDADEIEQSDKGQGGLCLRGLGLAGHRPYRNPSILAGRRLPRPVFRCIDFRGRAWFRLLSV